MVHYLYMSTNPSQRYSFGLWIAKHRKLLHFIYVGFWCAIAGASILLFVVRFFDWAVHIEQTNEILTNLPKSINKYESRRPPKDLILPLSQAVNRDEGAIDIVVQIENTNDIWAATDVEYEIFSGGKSLGSEHISLAPFQKIYVTKIDIPHAGTDLPAISTIIHNITWKKFPNLEDLPVVDWTESDHVYKYIQAAEEGSALPFETEFSFNLRNNSVYGFRESRAVVLMKDEENVIHAIGAITMSKISSLEQKQLRYLWPKKLPRVLTADINIAVDLLTEDRIIRTWQ